MSGVTRIAPTTPIYRPQLKRQQKLYVVHAKKNKITSWPYEIKPADEVKIDVAADIINLIVCAGAGIVIAGSLLGLLIHYLGGWGLAAMAALGLAVYGVRGLWRVWAEPIKIEFE